MFLSIEENLCVKEEDLLTYRRRPSFHRRPLYYQRSTDVREEDLEVSMEEDLNKYERIPCCVHKKAFVYRKGPLFSMEDYLCVME